MQLVGIDYIIVIAYLVGMVIIGSVITRYIKSTEDYFLAGRLLPFWAIGMSIVVTDICATDMVGVAGQAFRYGISVANFDWIGSFPAMIIAAFIFIPYYWRTGVYTIPEFLGRRFNLPVRTVQAVIWILFIVLDMGIIFYACSLLLQTLMGWSYWNSAIFSAVILGAYTITGGLAAVVLTDVVQLVLMFVGGFAMTILGLWELGGWSGLVDKIYSIGPEFSRHFDLFMPADASTPYPWTGILFGLGIIMSTAYFVGNQTIVQRCLGAKNEWHAKASMLVGALLKAFIPVLVVTPGLIALALYHNTVTDGDTAVPHLIKMLLPPGITGLTSVAFLAAMMSTMDSMLNSVSTLWTKDIYQKFIYKNANDKHLLLVGRIFTLFVLVFGLATSKISSNFPGMYVYVQTLLSFFQGPTLAILLLGIFWKRATAWGGFFGLIIGVLSALLMTVYSEAFFSIEDPFLYVSIWSFVLTIIVTFLISLFTKPHSEEKLTGLVYGIVMKSDAIQSKIKERANA